MHCLSQLSLSIISWCVHNHLMRHLYENNTYICKIMDLVVLLWIDNTRKSQGCKQYSSIFAFASRTLASVQFVRPVKDSSTSFTLTSSPLPLLFSGRLLIKCSSMKIVFMYFTTSAWLSRVDFRWIKLLVTWFHSWPLIKVSGVHRSLLLLMGVLSDKFWTWIVLWWRLNVKAYGKRGPLPGFNYE